MHPFVNERRRVIFWWSAKCGCTTVKSIMLESMVYDFVSDRMSVSIGELRESVARVIYESRSPNKSIDFLVSDFARRNSVNGIHCLIAGSYKKVQLKEAESFANILFVRNPFERFVSGLIDKHVEGSFTHMFRPESFRHAARNIGRLEEHHFAPQASRAYMRGLRYDRVFNIKSIDYAYLSSLLGMEVKPRTMHRKRVYESPCVEGLPSLPYESLAEIKSSGSLPSYECFYDIESKSFVQDYYWDDFELMRRLSPPSCA